MDMDEGPERTRLRLRPNHAFYDTYEVLAPAQPSSTPALLKADEKSASQEGALSTDAETAGTDGATAKPTVAAVAKVKTVATSPTTAATGDPDDDEQPETEPEEDGDAEAEAADGEAGAVMPEEQTVAAAAAAAAAALAALESGESDPMPDIGPTVEGGSVAAIAAIVKSMNQTVGVGKGKTGTSRALTSVFDLDDTDTSALLELEELHLDEVPEGTEEVRERERERRCCTRGLFIHGGERLVAPS